MQKTAKSLFIYLILFVYFCIRQRAIETGWWLSVGSSCVPSVASAEAMTLIRKS